MGRYHRWQQTKTQKSVPNLMNVLQTIQGVANLKLGCNLCPQFIGSHFNSSVVSQTTNNRLQMRGHTETDFIPFKNADNSPSCKKKATLAKYDGSVSPPHGGKKRRENHGNLNQQLMRHNCVMNLPQPAWVLRNYCPGMVGLHDEIEDFYNYIRPTEEEKCMREHVIKSVKDIVLQLWPTAELDVFGSFPTNLYLPTSDIDIVLFGKWKFLPLWELKEELVGKGIADEHSVKVLDRAAVPIIKFRHPGTGVKVDISFNMKSGVQSVQLIKDYMEKYPTLPKLIFVLKQFLVMRDLNEVWTGGVSSYSLILLCVSFLQLHWRSDAAYPDANLGVLLIEFFELYGKHFNFQNACISVKGNGGLISKEEFRQQLDNGSAPSLLSIEDPLTPGNDLGRGSYCLLQVRNAFNHAYLTLTSALYKQREYSDYQPVSLLSLIIQISLDIIELRSVVRNRRQLYLSTSSIALVSSDLPHPPRCSTGSSECSNASSSDEVNAPSSEDYISSYSVDSETDYHTNRASVRKCHVNTAKRNMPAQRAKSADCLRVQKGFSANTVFSQVKNPSRTHSADRKKTIPRKGAHTSSFVAISPRCTDSKSTLISMEASEKSETHLTYSNAVKLKAAPGKKAAKANIDQQPNDVTKVENYVKKDFSKAIICNSNKNHKQQTRTYRRNLCSQKNNGRNLCGIYGHSFNPSTKSLNSSDKLRSGR
ncbi:uncharacterized protein LOC143451601 isoform X1 [Clavelina lepadiformis]|uniref:uncharacterized protein LOC143451601 isoform X1 n=2 Tax=Clavelina lepadiformis TaxID=159417 RepID=UPI0040437119